MLKKWYFYSSLTIIIAFLSSGFKPFNLETNPRFLIDELDETDYLFPSISQNKSHNLNVPFTGNYFIGFKEAIGFRESQCKYKKINTLGYLGKYQFGMETLKSIGITDRSLFLNNPELQEKAFIALLSKNKWELKEVINKYEGQVVAGILVTESGILAAAHLGGPGSVRKFFKHEGKRYFKDAYGTSIRSYMKDFGGYDTSFIIADSNASIS